jgi:hypothetical protein
MKTMNPKLLAAALALCFATGRLGAQAFTSGSTGADGALDVTAADVTVNLPPEGILHYTTITIAAGRTLRFKPNALNTPVYLLATGDVTIAGSINLNGSPGNGVSGGLPGPGGFAGGNPGSAGPEAGDGHGPGGGKAGSNSAGADGAGAGGFATKANSGNSTRHGASYGSALLLPLVGGSGGGGTTGTPGNGGGGGGGAVLVASSTRITFSAGGTIRVDGANIVGNAYNFGAGGAVRLVAPLVAGNGIVQARSANGNYDGHGRIRVDTLDLSQLALNFNPPATASLGSLMLVFPTPLPRLDVIAAAGTAIPVGSGPVIVNLPFNSPAAQVVKVQAKDFGQLIPIRVVLTPDHGPAKSYDAEINNAAGNPAEVSVNVEFPVNVQTAVEVWTR